ncbi:MAG: RDD family protein [Kangiellaceae bacterium]|nr:RDD family protein [Kangiellaceae bacterium]
MKSYPKLFLRIQAMLWDSAILGIFFITIAILSSKNSVNNEVLRALIIVVPALSLEPLLVYFSGSSIGHRIAGIKISHVNTDKNLSLLQCYGRFITKLILGIYSLIALVFTRKHQALHDLLSKSIVVFIDENKAPANHKLTERNTEYRTEKPSWIRRVVVTVIYIILFFVLLSIVSAGLIPAGCIEFNVCSENEVLLLDLIGYLLIGVTLTLLIMGSICKLPGIFYKSEQRNST